MQKQDNQTLTDRAFRISLYLKGLNGLLEILGGILLILISPEQINHWAKSITEGELSQDPNNFIATHILKTAHHLSGGSLTYGAIYLLSHGVVKLFVIIQVLRGKLWAYPALMGVLGLFVIYQTYSMIAHFSFGMLLLTVFDLFIIFLTTIEYRKHKAMHASTNEA
jgi:uncharacterized membrane protein